MEVQVTKVTKKTENALNSFSMKRKHRGHKLVVWPSRQRRKRRRWWWMVRKTLWVWWVAWCIVQSINSIFYSIILNCVFSSRRTYNFVYPGKGGMVEGGGELRKRRPSMACWQESNNLQQHVYQLVDIVLFVMSIPAEQQQGLSECLLRVFDEEMRKKKSQVIVRNHTPGLMPMDMSWIWYTSSHWSSSPYARAQ